MAKRKPVPPEKQKYLPVTCALKAGLLDRLKKLGERLGLQRTKIIDRIVAGIIREDWAFNKLYMAVLKNPAPEQKALLDELQSGPLRCAYVSLHKTTMPDFLKVQEERRWRASMLLERMLTAYLLAPEEERIELLEPQEPVKTLPARTYEEVIAEIPEIEAEMPEIEKEKPDPPQEIKIGRQDRNVKFLLGVEKGMSKYLLDYASGAGTTRNGLVESIILEVCGKGMIFMGDVSVLDGDQKELYGRLTDGKIEYNYLMIRKSAAELFEKAQRLTAWEPKLLLKRMILTWAFSPPKKTG